MQNAKDSSSDRTARLYRLFSYILMGGLMLLTLLAIIKSIFVSFDIDEGYAIAQSYRLLVDDRMVADLWEPHQFSSWAATLFMWPFLRITGGDTTGIIIYLRIAGSLIHLLIGIWFFCAARSRFGSFAGALIALIHVNFLPKWVSIPEFEILHYWAVCIIFLALLTWTENAEKKIWLPIAGTAFFATLLSYPTMVILYPFYVAALWLLYKATIKEKFLALLYFTLPAALLGFGFLGYLLSYQSIPAFIQNIKYILMDDSHSVSLLDRGMDYCMELLRFLPQLLLYLAISFAANLGIWGIRGLFTKEKRKIDVRLWILYTLLIAVGLFSVTQIVVSFLGEANQFYLYFRFLVIAILGIVSTFLCVQKDLRYLLLGILPGLASVLASAAITNMSFEIALAKIYIAVMATCFLVCLLIKENYDRNKVCKSITIGAALLFLMGLLVCKLLLVRATGCIAISVKMHMDPVHYGPVAGILAEEKLAAHFNHCIPILQENITDEDRLLYFGCENIFYLASDATIATPSVQGTAVFNEMYLHYYEEHPDKLPNVVVIDKTFETNPVYRYAPQNYIMADWIRTEFADATVVETDYLTILRK